jgi:lipid-A-disaccharide synthase-like uncharacterized protein
MFSVGRMIHCHCLRRTILQYREKKRTNFCALPNILPTSVSQCSQKWQSVCFIGAIWQFAVKLFHSKQLSRDSFPSTSPLISFCVLTDPLLLSQVICDSDLRNNVLIVNNWRQIYERLAMKKHEAEEKNFLYRCKWIMNG